MMKVLQMTTDAEGLTTDHEDTPGLPNMSAEQEKQLNLKPNANILCLLIDDMPDIPDGYRLEKPGDRQYDKPADALFAMLRFLGRAEFKWVRSIDNSGNFQPDCVYCVPEDWDPEQWPKWTVRTGDQDHPIIVRYDADNRGECLFGRIGPGSHTFEYSGGCTMNFGPQIRLGFSREITEAEAMRLIEEAQWPKWTVNYLGVDPFLIRRWDSKTTGHYWDLVNGVQGHEGGLIYSKYVADDVIREITEGEAKRLLEEYKNPEPPVCVCGNQTKFESLSSYRVYCHCGRSGPWCETKAKAVSQYPCPAKRNGGEG